MKHYGLIGEKLGHSLSQPIHEAIFREMGIDADYRIIEIPRNDFVPRTQELLATLDGFNVTIPYKQDVMPLLETIDPAAAIGAVNTIRCGEKTGYNTDAAGFMGMLRHYGIDPAKGEYSYILGSGVATQLAATENPAGLVLICPFDSMTSVACNIVPFFPRLLPLDKWQSTKYAPRVTCPVTIMRADYDDVVPANSTEKLIRAFRTPPAIRHYPANHNNVFTTTGFTQDLLQAMPVTDQSRFDF